MLNAHYVMKMLRIQPADNKTTPATCAINVCVPCEDWRPNVWEWRHLLCDVTPCNLVERRGVSEIKFLQDYKGTGASSPCALGVRRTLNTNSSPIWDINAWFNSAGEMLSTMSFCNASSLLPSSLPGWAFLVRCIQGTLRADVAVRGMGKTRVLDTDRRSVSRQHNLSVFKDCSWILECVAARKFYCVDIIPSFLPLFCIILAVK